MEAVIKVIPIQQAYAYPKDISTLLGYGNTKTHDFLNDFKKFVKERPSFFKPHEPIIQFGNDTPRYNILCILYFNEKRGLLMSGARTLSFREELPRLKEAWLYV